MKYIKSNKTNGWPPAVSLLPKTHMKGEKERGAESMKHNTTLLVHHEQIPKQRKDRKYNNNMKKSREGSRKHPENDGMSGKKSTIRLLQNIL